MRGQQEQVLIGVRVPLDIKVRLSSYCQSHGVKINFFVALAIKERLQEILEENEDIKTAKKRFSKPEFISQQEFNKYLAKRGQKT